MDNVPVVLPVKDRDDVPPEKPVHPHLPSMPCLLLMCSPIRTGMIASGQFGGRQK